MVTNKDLSKILLVVLIFSIILIPVIANQHSLYKLKTIDDSEGIQKCVDEGFFTREECEETYSRLDEEFLEDYRQVSFAEKYWQGFKDAFSYYWYYWIVPIILFLIYLEIRKKK